MSDPTPQGGSNSRLEEAVYAMQQTMASLQTSLANNTHANQDLNQSVKDLRIEMSQTYVRKDVLEPTIETLKTNVKEHDDWITWVTRIVIALVLAAVIGGVLVTGK